MAINRHTEDLRARTKRFARRVVTLVQPLPKASEAKVLGSQLLRSGTSVAANHRAACRARSRPEFTAKLGTVVEETDESLFWLELLLEAGLMPSDRLDDLIDETTQLLAIFSASRRTAKSRKGLPARVSDSASPGYSEQ